MYLPLKYLAKTTILSMGARDAPLTKPVVKNSNMNAAKNIAKLCAFKPSNTTIIDANIKIHVISHVCLLPKIDRILFGLCLGSGKLSMKISDTPKFLTPALIPSARTLFFFREDPAARCRARLSARAKVPLKIICTSRPQCPHDERQRQRPSRRVQVLVGDSFAEFLPERFVFGIPLRQNFLARWIFPERFQNIAEGEIKLWTP